MAANLSELLGPSMKEAFTRKYMLDMVGLGTPHEFLVFAAERYSESMTRNVATLRVSRSLENKVEAARELDIDPAPVLVKAAEIAFFEGRQKLGKFGGAAGVIVSFEQEIALESATR